MTTLPNDPVLEREFLQKIVDFQDLMRKAIANDAELEGSGLEVCDDCHSSTCLMIQKSNDLLCHQRYVLSHADNTLTIVSTL